MRFLSDRRRVICSPMSWDHVNGRAMAFVQGHLHHGVASGLRTWNRDWLRRCYAARTGPFESSGDDLLRRPYRHEWSPEFVKGWHC